MTATTLLEMAQRDGVRLEFSPSGGLKASGPRDALAKWLPELKAMKPAIAAAAAQVNDAAHRCGRVRTARPLRMRRACTAGRGRTMVLRRASSARGWDSVTTELDTAARPRSRSAAAVRMRRHREWRRIALHDE